MSAIEGDAAVLCARALRLMLEGGITAVPLGCARQGHKVHLALLVGDETLQKARDFQQALRPLRLHFFTPSGADGASFRLDHPDYRSLTLAVLPKALADRLLADVRRDGETGAEEAFRLAAYVRAYFGSAARLMGLGATAVACDDLPALARAAGKDAPDPSDRAVLHDLLPRADWRPSGDMLERLSLSDDWIREVLLPRHPARERVEPGLSIFFCRACAVETGGLSAMQEAVAGTGFEIVHSMPLDGPLARRIEQATRGGNWGAGPFPVSGGPPAHILVAVDVFPVPPPASVLRKHPFLDNHRTLLAKLAARAAVTDALPASERFNPLHSTDTGTEALKVLRQLLSEAEAEKILTGFRARHERVDELRLGADRLPGQNWQRTMVRLTTPDGPRLRLVYREAHANALPATAVMQARLAQAAPDFLDIVDQGEWHLDMADPGPGFRPPGPDGGGLPPATILRLRRLLEDAASAGAELSAFDPRHDLLFSDATGRLALPPPGLCTPRTTARPLSDLVPAGPDYTGAWYPCLRVPRAMFLTGGRPSIAVYSRVVYPLLRALRRTRRRARRKAAALKRRLKGS